MPSLEFSDKFVRALGTIGGRSLLKCTESMVSSALAVINKAGHSHRLQSDAKSVSISSGGKPVIRIELEIKELKMDGTYYKYQKGKAVFTARDSKPLERFRSALIEVAEFRKRYLLDNYTDEQLSRYGLDKGFVAELTENVNALKVS
jgi:hypothetical protein